ncbi:MAG TPA: serine hydrolase [Caulobacteraceae bacterium]|nr:serine hydrolase [Caulobacteraceae bacterium]
MDADSRCGRPDRRRLALGLAALLAGCGKAGSPLTPRFDGKVLDKGFPALADRARPGMFDAAILDLSDNASWFWNINRPFPLESAFILPMAAAVLGEVDNGLVKLTDHVTVRDVDLSPPYSLIAQSWRDQPGFAMNVRVGDLLALAVQYNDNTAADVLMSVIGGPGAVTAWLRNKGVQGMRVDRYAREIQTAVAGLPAFRASWRTPAAFAAARAAVPVTEREAAMAAYLADPRDTTTAQDAITFLTKLGRGALLSPASTALLLKTMGDSGPGPLGAALPKGARFARKGALTATDLGLTPAAAELGILTFADGRRFAACAFLAGATSSKPQRDRLFADAGRLIAQATGEGG